MTIDEARRFFEGDQWTPEQLANPEKLNRDAHEAFLAVLRSWSIGAAPGEKA